MSQTPRLFQPRAEAAQTLADENEYHLLIQQLSPHLAEEDTNMGDEAFVWLREDPEFLSLIVR